jgi:hypothetical protein
MPFITKLITPEGFRIMPEHVDWIKQFIEQI